MTDDDIRAAAGRTKECLPKWHKDETYGLDEGEWNDCRLLAAAAAWRRQPPTRGSCASAT